MALPKMSGFDDRDLTVINQALKNLDKTRIRTVLWFMPSDAAVGADKSAFLQMDFNATIVATYARAKTGPGGADLVFDINKNGTSIWANRQGNRLKIASGSNSGSQVLFDTTLLNKNDTLSIDIDQVGSSTAGKDVTVKLTIQEI